MTNVLHLLFSTSSNGLLAVAALIVSACVAIPTVFSLRRQKPDSIISAMSARLSDCEKQIHDLKRDLADCSKKRSDLEDENLRLMRELLRKNGH